MIPTFTAGQELAAADLNALASLCDGSRSSVGSTAGFTMLRASAGGSVSRRRRRSILARLEGAANPYAFTQRIQTAPGSSVDGPLSGLCYEVNDVPDLDGMRVRLHPDGFGSWRFQWVSEVPVSTTCRLCLLFREADETPSGGLLSVYYDTGGISVVVNFYVYNSYCRDILGVFGAGVYSYSLYDATYGTLTGSFSLTCPGTTDITIYTS